ncbi:MAG: hypothetical protein WB760_29940 [Xanthobacteraceae bacterium]
MTDDVHFPELRCSLAQPENNLRLSQDGNGPVRSINHVQKMPTEMIIGPWYLDEFGNPSREIRARD